MPRSFSGCLHVEIGSSLMRYWWSQGVVGARPEMTERSLKAFGLIKLHFPVGAPCG